MKSKLFDYIDRDNFIYNLSGLTKLVAFICLTFSVMFSYDIRYIIFVLVLSFCFFRISEISFRQVRTMMIYVGVFLLLIFCLTYLFSLSTGQRSTGRPMRSSGSAAGIR